MNLMERLLYRDGLMLVIDKPTGWVVHGLVNASNNLEPLFPALRFGLPRPPSPVHRLDRGTSGCLVLGRHPKAVRRLNRLFADHGVEKRYWALVRGQPPEAQGTVDRPLLEISQSCSGLTMAIDPGGQAAVTHYRTLGQIEGMTWLELIPVTGRTHQLRVHCQSLGCPVAGDYRYGSDTRGPLCLHARQITLPLYPNRPPITVTAPLPSHLEKMIPGP
ncbi:MAG: RNA pseudouridine synthase [Magnetococcales bacterium]|nr:RNA pseudouridine synthase [Magnetococcales bacterium]MBF0148414.1 RNA pseudouridine synthase [Magnetococcales bacterium]